METHKCIECQVPTNFYCQRCREWFCMHHQFGHLTSSMCLGCLCETCTDQMSPMRDHLCNRCDFLQQMKDIKAKFLEIKSKISVGQVDEKTIYEPTTTSIITSLKMIVSEHHPLMPSKL